MFTAPLQKISIRFFFCFTNKVQFCNYCKYLFTRFSTPSTPPLAVRTSKKAIKAYSLKCIQKDGYCNKYGIKKYRDCQNANSSVTIHLNPEINNMIYLTRIINFIYLKIFKKFIDI